MLACDKEAVQKMVQPHPSSAALDVVIPMYNEESRLAYCMEQLAILNTICQVRHVFFVDDGSTDDSVDHLRRLKPPPWVQILTRPHLGKGAAVRYGLSHCQSARVLVTDIDWSVNPSWIPQLLNAQADVVIAVREGHGARRIGEPVWRHMLGRVFNRYVQWMAMAGHADTQCGCKIVSQEAIKSLLPRLKTNGWAFDVELLAQAHICGYLVSEVPVACFYDADSRVRPIRDGLQMAVEVIRIRRRLKRTTVHYRSQYLHSVHSE